MSLVYLVTRVRANGSTETQGIFTTEGAARKACRTWEDTFIPIELDKEYPQDRTNCCDVFHPASGSVMRAGTTEWVPEESSKAAESKEGGPVPPSVGPVAGVLHGDSVMPKEAVARLSVADLERLAAGDFGLSIRIDKCTDPSAWYADRIGQTIPVERFEPSLRPSQGLPEDVYWCRTGDAYNTLNYVRSSDATRVGLPNGVTTDPTDPRLRRGIDETPVPQNEVYIVLSDEERAKGFVRPVRSAYTHLKCGTTTRMGSSIAMTYARDPKFYGSTYCVHCQMHRPVGADGEFVWAGTNEKVGT